MDIPYKVLSSKQVLKKINQALKEKKPLSVVSLGATETYVMAQYILLPEKQFMKHPQAVSTNNNKSRRGFTFPNVKLRDELIKAARKADIIAYPLSIRTTDAGLMTEKVFKKTGIRPKYVFEALLRRVMMVSQKKRFEDMLRNRKILLIGRSAEEVKAEMDKAWKDRLGFRITGAIPIDSYADVPAVKQQIDDSDFDLCLLCAGVYAVILATYIAEKHGKVAFDLGQGLLTLASGNIQVTAFVRNIGLDKLMKM